MNNDCFCNLHLTTACGGASPQGEAFERFASKPYVSQSLKNWHPDYTVFIIISRSLAKTERGENMNLWQTFEIERNKYSNKGISFRYEKGIDENLKEKYKAFAKWLRNTYVFPIHVTVYVKNCEKVKLLNGKLVYGSFRWFENKAPYIRIPSKINLELYQQYDEEELYESVLSSLVHELTHYFQWVLRLEQDDRTSERQANYFRFRIIDKFNLRK